jgi:hypothetical protein
MFFMEENHFVNPTSHQPEREKETGVISLIHLRSLQLRARVESGNNSTCVPVENSPTEPHRRASPRGSS